MSKDNEELIRRRLSLDDEADPVVERQPRSDFSILPIIIVIFVLYQLFNVLSENESVIQVLTDSILSEEATFNQQSLDEEYKEISIHQLVSKGDVSEVEQRLLISDREAINEVVAGMTPIMLAATSGSVEIIDLLFTQGANPNKRGSMQRTALQYATEKNHIEAAMRLLSYGAEIDAYDNGRLTPLIMAASRGHSELALLYIEKGADVNIQHIQGWTALIDAAAHGDTKLVKALLEANADKDLAAENGMKAIDYAREYRFTNIVKILGK